MFGSLASSTMALRSVAPMYEVVMMRSLCSLVNSLSSSMMSRSPLHLMKETMKSILWELRISFFSSFIIEGSSFEPVKRVLVESEVSGRGISPVFLW